MYGVEWKTSHGLMRLSTTWQTLAEAEAEARRLNSILTSPLVRAVDLSKRADHLYLKLPAAARRR